MLIQTLYRGATLSLQAPAADASFRMRGSGKSVTGVAVDGELELQPTVTSTLPSGIYATEWQWTDAGKVRIMPGPRVEVLATLSMPDPCADNMTAKERLLHSAELALANAAGNAAISISAANANYSFESRGDLLSFVRRLRRDVRRERGKA